MKKKKRWSEAAPLVEDRGERWTCVHGLPRSGCMQTVPQGQRPPEEAETFIETIHSNSDGAAPLLLRDGWATSQEAVEKVESHEERVPYAGRGRPRKPLRGIASALQYAQVVKRKSRGRLVEGETRVLRGREAESRAMIRGEHRGHTIKTSSVASRHGKYRQDHKRLTRRSACQAKQVELHDAPIDWMTSVYNFVAENAAFRQCIHSIAKRFEVKEKKFSPAMLEGFTDRLLTLEEF